MIIYIFAISFQLTGAILLISNFLPFKKAISKALSQKNPCWIEQNDDESYSREDCFKQAKQNYNNLFALIVVFLGYSLGVFGEVHNRWISLVCIIILTIFLYFTIQWLCKNIAIKKYYNDDSIDGK